MSLPQVDEAYLVDRGLAHEVSVDRGMICVLLPGFALPAGYDRPHADLLLRLPAGFPDVQPDMWWFSPDVRLADASLLPCTDQHETYLDRSWQRWSRHFAAGQWRSGVDCLETFIALIRAELERGVAGKSARAA